MSDQARKICEEVRRRVSYRPEKGDHWQMPDETWNKRGGDCEDFAILIISKCKKAGIKARLVLGYTRKGSHAVAAGDGWYASNARYYRTTNLGVSMRKELGWDKIQLIEVNSAMLRRKGIRL